MAQVSEGGGHGADTSMSSELPPPLMQFWSHIFSLGPELTLSTHYAVGHKLGKCTEYRCVSRGYTTRSFKDTSRGESLQPVYNSLLPW